MWIVHKKCNLQYFGDGKAAFLAASTPVIKINK